ncbi:hypothetical protein Hanom_Chr08g00748451 [Helianthus anomalus]
MLSNKDYTLNFNPRDDNKHARQTMVQFEQKGLVFLIMYSISICLPFFSQ